MQRLIVALGVTRLLLASAAPASAQLPPTGYTSTYAGVQLDGKQCVPAARDLSIQLLRRTLPFLGANGEAADLWVVNSPGFAKVANRGNNFPPARASLISGDAGWPARATSPSSSAWVDPQRRIVRVVDGNWFLNQRGAIHDVVPPADARGDPRARLDPRLEPLPVREGLRAWCEEELLRQTRELPAPETRLEILLTVEWCVTQSLIHRRARGSRKRGCHRGVAGRAVEESTLVQLDGSPVRIPDDRTEPPLGLARRRDDGRPSCFEGVKRRAQVPNRKAEPRQVVLRLHVLSKGVELQHHPAQLTGVVERSIPVPLRDKRDPEREKEVTELVQLPGPKDEEA